MEQALTWPFHCLMEPGEKPYTAGQGLHTSRRRFEPSAPTILDRHQRCTGPGENGVAGIVSYPRAGMLTGKSSVTGRSVPSCAIMKGY